VPIRPESIIVHEEVRLSHESWEALAAQHRQPAQAVWRSLQAGLRRLRDDAQWGEVVRQAFIPDYFREKYGVSNLYCMDLAAFHRCFYTIANRAVLLLDLVDHPAYDRWFPGRRKR
jgi:hypothetical protein